MTRFAAEASRLTGRDLAKYSELHAWSVASPDAFWAACADFCGVKWAKPPEEGGIFIPPPSGRMRGATWFCGARLNFAENCMPAPTDRVALVSVTEGASGPVVVGMTGREIHIQVARCAAALRNAGVRPGDRVAGVMANTSEALVCSLAATAVGAVWSSCSPDFGVGGVLDRLGQIGPRVVFFSTSYRYNGLVHDSSRLVAPVMAKMPPGCLAVAVPAPAAGGMGGGSSVVAAAGAAAAAPAAAEAEAEVAATMALADFLESGGVPGDSSELPDIGFVPGEFGRPVYIMFSSGTTGLPKCMVHGAGGTLLNLKKELILHCDVDAGSRLLFYTTTGWMMWNWQAATLSVPGATLVTYDGSPAWPRTDALWRLAAAQRLTHLGLSPKYIAACMAAGVSPRREGLDLSPLRTVLSTGSPLLPEHFAWVYSEVKEKKGDASGGGAGGGGKGGDLHLASISGGTDILGCFMLGNPNVTVRAGEIQCLGLGMDVVAYDEKERRAVTGRKAELVCRSPFPSMPVAFWNDPDGEKYRNAYFVHFSGGGCGNSGADGGNDSGVRAPPGGGGDSDVGDGSPAEMWWHGDYIEFVEGSGVVVHGRSDSTLNPGGVRIGTAEIYRQLHGFPEVADAVAVGRRRPDGDVEVALFLKMAPGAAPLVEGLVGRVKAAIRANLTARHVPKHVMEVTDIPYTRSGKKIEVAVTKALHGEAIDNTSAMANPECLSEFMAIGKKLAEQSAASGGGAVKPATVASRL